MVNFRGRLKGAFDRLVDGRYVDVFLDTNQVFPPSGRANSTEGPIHQGYVSLIDYRRLTEVDDPQGCRQAADYIMEFSTAYRDLLIEFAASHPFFVVPEVADELRRFAHALDRTAEDWRRGSAPQDMDLRLWNKLVELIRFQTNYVSRLVSPQGILTPKTTDMNALSHPGYNIRQDIEQLKDFIGSTDYTHDVRKLNDGIDIALAATAIASSIRRDRKSKVFSKDRSVSDHVENAFFESGTTSTIPVLNNGAHERLSRRSTSVGVYYVGVKGDLFTSTNTAALQHGDGRVREIRKIRIESRRSPEQEPIS